MIENPHYNVDGSITATVDGVISTIPDDPSNRHRREIDELGLSISPYTPPTKTIEEIRAEMPALTSRQFWLAANAVGISKDAVLAQIATIADPSEREALRIEAAETASFNRTHSAVDELATAMGVTPTQLDDLWTWGAAL